MTTILALRSYGDFVVLMNAIKHTEANSKMNILASEHLKPLWEALILGTRKNEAQFQFLDLNIKRGILSFFTNKYLFTKECVTELLTLRKFLNQYDSRNASDIYIERFNRKQLLQWFMGRSFKVIDKYNNVYESAFKFFDSNFNNEIQINKEYSKIIMLPDSRIAKKIIPIHVQNELFNFCKHHNIELITANFGNEVVDTPNIIFYNNFQKLVNIIENAEFIISSDSLTAHLAQFYNKPHFVLYPDKINHQWLTPWSKATISYATFDEFHILFNKINGI